MFDRVLGVVCVALLVTGCAQSGGGGGAQTPVAMLPPPEGMARPKPRPDGAAIRAPAANARTVEQFDTTTASERQAAVAVPVAAETRLGTTVASLGNPADPGFWAETGLVRAVTQGRLEYPETGKSVVVELRPSGAAASAGSRVSLPALRLLDAPLTSLPELVVFAGG